MSAPQSKSRPDAVRLPTRAERRTARQILADVGCGNDSPALDRIAAGPLQRLAGFLSGCELIFLLIGWDERGRLHASGGPSAGAVRSLVDRLLADDIKARPPHCPAAARALDVVGQGINSLPRSEASLPDLARYLAAQHRILTEWAVGDLVDRLHDREVSFLLGWQLPDQDRLVLDRSVGAVREKIDELLLWFLDERLPAGEAMDTGRSAAAAAFPSRRASP